MSTALKVAIVARLVADTALTALLAKDPNDASIPQAPAIFNASKNQAPPVYNCVTYRVSSDSPDGSFRPGIPGGAAVQQIADVMVDFEVWTMVADAAPIEAMLDRLDALLHQVAFSTTEGMAFWSERVTKQPDLYDKTTNAWYGLARYHVRTSKG